MKRLMFYLSFIIIVLTFLSCSNVKEDKNNYKITEKQLSVVTPEPAKQTEPSSQKVPSKLTEQSTLEEATASQQKVTISQQEVTASQQGESISQAEIKYYEIKHKASNEKYWVTITKDEKINYKLSLYDDKSVELQSFDLNLFALTDMRQVDLNADGYTDLLFGSNETSDVQKVYQNAYLWDPSQRTYVTIKYVNFYALTNFKIKNDYIVNLPNQNSSNLPIMQILVFDGDALKMVKEFYKSQPQKGGEMYWVSITQDDNRNEMLTLSDQEFKVLQSTPVEDLHMAFPDMEFEDLNGDGYKDAVISLGGTWNETHTVFLWDPNSKTYTKVIFEGFDMLADYEVKNGYIENFIRGDNPDDSDKEKLVFDGNILKKID